MHKHKVNMTRPFIMGLAGGWGESERVRKGAIRTSLGLSTKTCHQVPSMTPSLPSHPPPPHQRPAKYATPAEGDRCVCVHCSQYSAGALLKERVGFLVNPDNERIQVLVLLGESD